MKTGAPKGERKKKKKRKGKGGKEKAFGPGLSKFPAFVELPTRVCPTR